LAVQRDHLSVTTVKLLAVASEVVGGDGMLALRLGIGETQLRAYMEDAQVLPDSLLLRAVDIILADRQSAPSFAIGQLPGKLPEDSRT
jgi:hypothetical protein